MVLAIGVVVTVKVAEVLVTLLTELVTTTSNLAPLSVAAVTGVV